MKTKKNKKISLKECAKECAIYIMDQDCEHEDYETFVEHGHDPRTHILYHAAVVLGIKDEFKEDVIQYNKHKK